MPLLISNGPVEPMPMPINSAPSACCIILRINRVNCSIIISLGSCAKVRIDSGIPIICPLISTSPAFILVPPISTPIAIFFGYTILIVYSIDVILAPCVNSPGVILHLVAHVFIRSCTGTIQGIVNNSALVLGIVMAHKLSFSNTKFESVIKITFPSYLRISFTKDSDCS